MLIIDNCTAHKPIELLKSDDGSIVAMFLPPNVTAVLQPMDQNPIRLVKLAYRSKLLCSVIANENVPIDVSLKAHSISDGILLLKSAWDELPQTVLAKAWNKIKNWDDKEYDDEDDIPLASLVESNVEYDNALKEVQSLLSKVGLNVETSIDDIEKWNEDEVLEDEDDTNEIENAESDADEPDIPKVTYTDAVQSINTLIKWYEINNDVTQVSNLLDMRTKMVKSYMEKQKKQTSVVDYFKPMPPN